MPSTPAERFVFINMRKLREGDSLPEGVRVDEITQTGALLSYRGTRFSLDGNRNQSSSARLFDSEPLDGTLLRFPRKIVALQVQQLRETRPGAAFPRLAAVRRPLRQ